MFGSSYMTFEELSASVYEDLNGRITAVTTVKDSYHVTFECNDWRDYDLGRRFELIFSGVVEATATPSSCGSVQMADDHPLLWEHNDDSASLFFSSPPPD